MTGTDPGEAARSVARSLPALVSLAESAGLLTLAGLLDAAWAEAERAEDAALRT